MSGNSNGNVYIIANSQVTPFLVQNRLKKYGFVIRHFESVSDLPSLSADQRPSISILELDSQWDESLTAQMIESYQQDYSEVPLVVTYLNQPDTVVMKGAFRAGAKYSYQIPFEEEVLFNKIFELCEEVKIPTQDLSLDALSRVFVPDITILKELPFDVYVYLPRNDKVIRYGRQGAPIEKRLLEKFGGEIKSSPLYVQKGDLCRYQNFYADKLADIHKSAATPNQQKEYLRRELSQLMGGLFRNDELSATEGQAMLDVVRNTVKDYLQKSSSQKEIFDRIYSLTSECSSNFNHATNTAMYGALFAMLMGYTNSLDFVMGGLLHDVGLSMIDPEIVAKKVEDMTADEFEKYKMHPICSVDILSRKKIPANSLVLKMILQHHEMPDGSGFPNGDAGADLHEFSAITSMADLFDDLTSIQPGQTLLTPQQAFSRIAGLDGQPPLGPFDKEFHHALMEAMFQTDKSTEEMLDAG